MLEKIIYTTSATAKGGREGHITSQDGAIHLDLIKPKELGGPGKVGANPETLFAAGYAACFESAIRFAAAQKNMHLGPDTYVTADVGIGPRKEGGFQLAVTLNVHIDGLDKQQAEMTALTAHNEICPYSHATRGNVEVQIKII